MTRRVTHHPTDDMLLEFVNGSLSTGLSVVLSAHIELCDHCRERRLQMEASASLAWQKEADQNPATRQRDFSPMLAAINNKLSSEEQETEARQETADVNEIHVLEGSIRLPRVLAKLAGEGIVWNKIAGGISQADVTLDGGTQCEFLYMKPGGQVPMHKHRGNEVTLVLDGSFSDELGHYQTADFVVRDGSHQHSPVSEEGCLCFAVQDSPLMFTRGLARLLNPFIKYRFKQALSRAR